MLVTSCSVISWKAATQMYFKESPNALKCFSFSKPNDGLTKLGSPGVIVSEITGGCVCGSHSSENGIFAASHIRQLICDDHLFVPPANIQAFAPAL